MVFCRFILIHKLGNKVEVGTSVKAGGQAEKRAWVKVDDRVKAGVRV